MNKFKFLLSLVLTVITLLLMDPRSFYGLSFHEWAGLLIGLFFILHKILNWGWIKKVTILFFSKTTWRARINYIIDIILLAGLVLIILSGIAISRTIDFSWIKLGASRNFWSVMHTSSSLITLAFFGMHLGLHWNWVLSVLKFKNTSQSFGGRGMRRTEVIPEFGDSLQSGRIKRQEGFQRGPDRLEVRQMPDSIRARIQSREVVREYGTLRYLIV